MRVLVVEDQPKFANLIRKGLEEQGMVVDLCDDGDEAFELATTTPFDAIILDIMLPGRDGLSILRGLRDTLSERTAVLVSHRVSALSLADHVLVLDEGRVVERGSHDELVAAGGLYAELEERQRIEAEIEAL